jgi:phosphoglucosamine mutase
MGKFFGTDGIRGRVNAEPMTAEIAMRVGQAAGAHFLRGDHRHRVVIGKDTRLSGYMMESAMVAGFTSVGMDVVLLGPMPTPAVAMLTRSMRADLGVMISASHNPYVDNGIKLFGPDGYKLSDEAEASIERRLKKEPKLAKVSTGSRSSSIARMAQPIRSRRKRYGSSGRSSFRSASSPTARTSTIAAGRLILKRSAEPWSRRARTSAWLSMGMPIA